MIAGPLAPAALVDAAAWIVLLPFRIIGVSVSGALELFEPSSHHPARLLGDGHRCRTESEPCRTDGEPTVRP